MISKIKINQTVLVVLLLSINLLKAQNIFDVSSYPSKCMEENGTLLLELSDPNSPTFPFPYTVELKNLDTGGDKYYEMLSSSLSMKNLASARYKIVVFFNETCKLELEQVEVAKINEATDKLIKLEDFTNTSPSICNGNIDIKTLLSKPGVSQIS